MESVLERTLPPLEAQGGVLLKDGNLLADTTTETLPYFRDGFSLGVDIDGVLIDNMTVWKNYFHEHAEEHGHDPKVIPYEDAPRWDYFYEICKPCFDSVLHDKEMISSYELVPEAEETLYWFKMLGINIHLITHRPPDVAEVTKEWAQKKLGYLTSSVNIVDNKVEIASALKCRYHIDDAPMHIKAFQTQKEVIPIIWSKPYNLGLEGFRVYSWPEAASLLMWKEHRHKF